MSKSEASNTLKSKVVMGVVMPNFCDRFQKEKLSLKMFKLSHNMMVKTVTTARKAHNEDICCDTASECA